MDKPLALIIEDDRDIAALFRHVLDIAGYRTEIVMNGSEALRRLDAPRPDIVLLDLNLPGAPGAVILEHMRLEPRLQGVPVVVITAHSELAENLPVEPDLVLMKPVNLDQLSSLVRRLRDTPVTLLEAPWDEVTHLYNRSFFTVRLAYALERLRESGEGRFAVLFLDLDPFPSLKRGMSDDQLNTLLRQTSSHLKSTLRPTDTLSRFDGGFFLILVEELPYEDILAKIAGRMKLELGDFLLKAYPGAGLQVYVGVVLCDSGYADVEELLKDIELARRLSRNREFVLYDRQKLEVRRRFLHLQ